MSFYQEHVLGLPRQRFHDLRHAAASLLLAQGVNPRVVMEILSTRRISLTLNTYSHVIPSLQSDATKLMGAMLSEARLVTPSLPMYRRCVRQGRRSKGIDIIGFGVLAEPSVVTSDIEAQIPTPEDGQLFRRERHDLRLNRLNHVHNGHSTAVSRSATLR